MAAEAIPLLHGSAAFDEYPLESDAAEGRRCLRATRRIRTSRRGSSCDQTDSHESTCQIVSLFVRVCVFASVLVVFLFASFARCASVHPAGSSILPVRPSVRPRKSAMLEVLAMRRRQSLAGAIGERKAQRTGQEGEEESQEDMCLMLSTKKNVT